ncbi:hypothetical protein EJB05_39863 [Eragrostis curvula]|uniref:Uncharacterized protein n=1 Tax=Eragrostis curvula TaxID=38414 RepID=A0A5J9TYA4_9POAL|nr:hypothetical protein EJB05_39863 [Eragrostis curvula]
MRTSVAFASLLLLLLAATAHGIRPDRQLQEAINKKQEMGDPKPGEASIAHSVNKNCDLDGHCSSSGTMKQMTPTVVAKDSQVTISAYAGPRFHEDYYGPRTAKTPPTHARSGAVKQTQGLTGNNGHNTTVVEAGATTTAQAGRHEAKATTSQEELDAATPRVPWQGQTYPDIMDIAGMDYSPAQRRSPIHN